MSTKFVEMTVLCHEIVALLRRWDGHIEGCTTCQDFENIRHIPRVPLNPPCSEGNLILCKIMEKLRESPAIPAGLINRPI